MSIAPCDPDPDTAPRRGSPDRARPLPLEAALSVQAKFLSRIEYGAPDECWNWTGNLRSSGYGTMTLFRRPIGAHRVAYALANGGIPPDLTIDHLCRNRRCVNPRHLDAVSLRENLRRRAVRDLCKNGHRFDGEAVRAGATYRSCSTCHREAQARHQAKTPAIACELCGTSVRPKNLPRHRRNVHGLEVAA